MIEIFFSFVRLIKANFKAFLKRYYPVFSYDTLYFNKFVWKHVETVISFNTIAQIDKSTNQIMQITGQKYSNNIQTTTA